MRPMPRAPRRRSPSWALVGVVLASAVACQPVDDIEPAQLDAPPEAATPPIDAPVQGLPAGLNQLVELTRDRAREWQDEPRLAEILVELTRDGRWERAELTYVAPDADRLLVVTVGDDGIADERTTLATLELQPIPATAMEELPPPPEDLMEPEDLARAARPELRGCDVSGRPSGVLYATGAPVAWDGRRWTEPPAWTATVTTGRGGVQLDPVTAELLGCVEASG